jgi:DNA-binding beta-propeller fold protein YncE
MAKSKGKGGKSASKKGRSKGAGKGWLWVLGAAGILLLVQAGNMIQKGASAKAFPVQKVLSFKGDGQECGPFQAWAVAQAGGDRVAVTDQGSNRVLVFDREGRFRMAFTQKEAGEPKFNELSGLASDAEGNLYVMDAWNSLIRGFDSKGRPTIKARVDNTYGPRGLEAHKGDFLIADTGVHRIARISPTGAILASWGRKGTGKGEFSDPLDVKAGPDGNLYVADSNNHRVQVLDAQGKFLKALDIEGVVNSLIVDKDGRVYATNQERGVVAVFGPNGKSLGKLTDAAAKVPTPLDGIKGLAALPDGTLVAGRRDEVLLLKPTAP